MRGNLLLLVRVLHFVVRCCAVCLSWCGHVESRIHLKDELDEASNYRVGGKSHVGLSWLPWISEELECYDKAVALRLGGFVYYYLAASSLSVRLSNEKRWVCR